MISIMSTVNTAQVIKDAREELRSWVANRQQTDKRIAELRILLRTLVRFMPDETQRQQVLAEVDAARRKAPSLTESISQILSESKKPISSNDIREQLETSGFDLDEYSQPLATIQSTLQRLVEQEKVSRDLAPDKSVLYEWEREPRKPGQAPRPTRGMIAKLMEEQRGKK
jgi:Fe2+ or Zn2+ uptake regulation protein